MAFMRNISAGYVLFCRTKENQKGRRCPEGMKAPVGLLSRRPVCEANAACSARQGRSDFDALDPTGCGTLRLLRALGGTRILQAAAPTAPPCIRHWRRSSPLQTRGCSPLIIPRQRSKRKNASRFAQTGCGAQRPLRALSGTRVLLTAAPTAPPCIRHWRRSSPLQTRGCSPLIIPRQRSKRKNASRFAQRIFFFFSLIRFAGPSVAARQLPAGERVQQIPLSPSRPLP